MKKYLPLLFIILVGFFSRIWGIDFGLPQLETRPDELWTVTIALRFLRGEFNPHFFNYPSLYMYILSFLYYIYYLVGSFLGRFTSIADVMIEFFVYPENFHLIARITSVAFGTATIFVTYLLSRSLFNRRIALVSSFFLSLAYLHVRDSHFGKIDVTMTFFLLTAMLFIVKSYKQRFIKHYLLAGLFAGLAISSKYSAFFIIAPMLVAHFFPPTEERTRFEKLIKDKKIFFFLTLLIIGFVLGTPYSVLGYREFIVHLVGLVQVLKQGFPNTYLGIGWWYHLRYSLLYGIGWSLLLASFLGSIVLAVREGKKALLLLSFPLVYYLVIGKSNVLFPRYLIPIVPFLCINAALFVEFVVEKVNKFTNISIKIHLMFLVAAIIVIPSFFSIVNFNRLLSMKDNRLVAAAWAYKNLERESSIYQAAGSNWTKIIFHQTLASIKKKYQLAERTGYSLEASLLRKEIEYMATEKINGFDLWQYDEDSRSFNFEKTEQRGLPQYIITYDSALIFYKNRKPFSGDIMRLLGTDYSLLKSFEVVDINNKRNFYDQQDAFYIPFAGFDEVERPGPNIYIYERN